MAGKSIEEIKKGKEERSGWKSEAEIHLERVAASTSKPHRARLEQGLPAELQVPMEPGLVTRAICAYLERFVLGAKALFGKQYQNVTTCPVNINAAHLTLGQPRMLRVCGLA